ncbi:MAG TPA: hypothetical protein VFB63_34945 [Bryobacteraceae bacterium]|nr:hypothetical protein [Bryobacteraceae bacterium]
MGLKRNRIALLLNLVFMVAALVSCGGAKKLEFPQEVPGGWKLRTKQQLAALNAPQSIQAHGLVSWWQAEYSGASDPTVYLYEMKTSADAFELVQKNRASPGLIAMNFDRFFVVMQTARGTLPDLNRFATAFEKAF